MTRARLLALCALVLARFVFHSFFVPAYDGPDEPFHLARVLAFARGPVGEAFRGAELPDDLAASVSRHPCGADLSRAFPCRLFPVKGSCFNLLSGPGEGSAMPAVRERNYENQQPPLYYALAGMAARAAGILEPESVLLFTRLLSVAFVALALLGPLRILSRSLSPAPAFLFLLALLVPGAAEALARGSNDALLFLWAALVLVSLSSGTRGPALAALVAAGPLIKLSAFAVVVFAVARLWRLGRRPASVACLFASLAVFPVQGARGWLLGATYTYGGPGPGESAAQILVGLLRSGWGLVKTAFWVGGWTAFRPPWLLVAATATIVALALSAARPVRLRAWPEHVLAALVALSGSILVAVGNRRFAGTWGGLCGWYLWGWSPWIAQFFVDTGSPGRGWRRPLLFAAIAVVFSANVLWFVRALEAYG